MTPLVKCSGCRWMGGDGGGGDGDGGGDDSDGGAGDCGGDGSGCGDDGGSGGGGVSGREWAHRVNGELTT